MTKLIGTGLLTLSIFVLASAQSSVERFRYQPEKIVVGTTYHYLKTNIDGTNPEHVSLYVAAKDRIEAFKFHPGQSPAALVIAEIDWSTFSTKRLESWRVSTDGNKQLFATLKYSGAEKAALVEIPSLGRSAEKVAISHLPFHVYNFDLASLNFAFRHLIDPETGFTIGIADPAFEQQGPIFKYRGEAEVSYVGYEPRLNIPCRKYKIDGAGLENKGGFIWVDKGDGSIVDMEIALPDNPDWQSFKLRLKRVQMLDRKGWESFMKMELQK